METESVLKLLARTQITIFGFDVEIKFEGVEKYQTRTN